MIHIKSIWEKIMEENGKNVPEGVKGWNWGAFAYGIFWGIGNKTYLPLLCLIPFFNFVWIFVCGFKGNEWAWQKGDYKDIETFKAVQSTWNRAGLVNFLISIAILTVYFILIAIFISSATNAKTY